jgi:16S rRNA (uracil1498-N3)-methyltransferase
VQYLYHKASGSPSLVVSGDPYRYLFKVRRHREGEVIALRNLQDSKIYLYQIASLSKKEAHLLLKQEEERTICAKRKLHIGWCVIDPKSVERLLPSLNEIGVDAITFIYCKRSQKSFRIDFARLEKILLNSSQQCGRSRMMQLHLTETLSDFLKENPNAMMLNFSQETLNKQSDIDSLVVGCEGGFTPDEVALFEANRIVGLDTPLILKSESAVCAVAAKLLL